MLEELLGDLEQRIGLLDVGHMAAPIQDDQPAVEGTDARLGRGKGYRVLPSVDDERPAAQRGEMRHEIVLAEALPDGLLYAGDDPERREIVRDAGIREVPRHAQLEGALPIGLRIAFAQTRRRQLFAKPSNLRRRLPTRAIRPRNAKAVVAPWIDVHVRCLRHVAFNALGPRRAGRMPMVDLAEAAGAWESRVRAAAEQDSELADYVRELEARSGEAELHALTGDEIADEFEKYLRRRGPRP
jgi:hypothetical protein